MILSNSSVLQNLLHPFTVRPEWSQAIEVCLQQCVDRFGGSSTLQKLLNKSCISLAIRSISHAVSSAAYCCIKDFAIANMNMCDSKYWDALSGTCLPKFLRFPPVDTTTPKTQFLFALFESDAEPCSLSTDIRSRNFYLKCQWVHPRLPRILRKGILTMVWFICHSLLSFHRGSLECHLHVWRGLWIVHVIILFYICWL